MDECDRCAEHAALIESLAIRAARAAVPSGESPYRCEECGRVIPKGRREAMPGVRYCVECQMELERIRRG